MPGDDGPEDVIYCQNCGQQLLETANFCDRCGQTVDATGGEVQEAVPASDGDDGGISRRKAIGYGAGGVVLGIVGLSFLMGATSATHENAGEDGWSGSTSTGTTSQTLSGTARLDSGEYLARSIQPEVSVQAEIQIDVQSGGPIDIFLIDRTDLNGYAEREENIHYYSSLSGTEVTSTALTGTISSGDYAFIIDNTGVYGADPDGEAVVDVELTLGL